MAGLRQYGSRVAIVLAAGCVVIGASGPGRAAAVAPPVATAAPPIVLGPGTLLPPVAPACISSPFGARRLVGPRAAVFHNGIDFPAPAGGVVRAAAAGRVQIIRRLGSEGLEVDVAHPGPDGGSKGAFVTRYAHLGTVTPALAEGQRILAAGAPIGRVGRTGITYGTHVHVEVRIEGKPVDPEPFFKVARCG